jgi:hypothetical protein
MSLDVIVENMATSLKVLVPELKVCEPIGGKVSLEQVQDMNRLLPAGFVACMGTRDGQLYGNKFRTRGLFCLSMVVKSEIGASKDKVKTIAALVGKAIYKIAFAGDWGNAEVDGEPQRISSLNPYTQVSHRENVATWMITWEQDLMLLDPGEIPELDDFLVAKVDYQSPDHPQIDTQSKIEPEQTP